MNRIIATILLSAHKICFGWDIKKIDSQYPRFSGGMSGLVKNIFISHKIWNYPELQNKEEGKDQESIQLSTTPEPGDHMGKR